jgi:hypothetical protein
MGVPVGEPLLEAFVVIWIWESWPGELSPAEARRSNRRAASISVTRLGGGHHE